MAARKQRGLLISCWREDTLCPGGTPQEQGQEHHKHPVAAHAGIGGGAVALWLAFLLGLAPQGRWPSPQAESKAPEAACIFLHRKSLPAPT